MEKKSCTKGESLRRVNISHQKASQYELMAANPKANNQYTNSTRDTGVPSKIQKCNPTAVSQSTDLELSDSDVAKFEELMKALPKASYDRGNQYTGGKTTAMSDSLKPKNEVIKDAGVYTKANG